MENKITELLANVVYVKCKLCDAEMIFDVNDESSFLSKTEHQDFFGMRLSTYRVQHTVNGEKHINAFLIDHRNLFRGHVDAYKIPALKEEEQFLDFDDLNNYMLLEEEIYTPESNNVLTNFFIASLDGWILEVVKIPKSKTEAILTSVFEKIEESKKIYEIIPQPLNVIIANLECIIWNEGRTYLIITFKNKDIVGKYNQLISQITTYIENNGIIPKKRIFKILNEILQSTDFAEKNPDLILRLLSDNLYYSRIMTQYPERIDTIISKITKRFTFSENTLKDLLLGKFSLIELFELQPELITECKEIIEILDFINRRKLLA
ncbi:MAG: hypothetical protein JXA54_11760 [Candidatus Heimdallarchaeota archaeon]|nr:hypothetical protein [Candidatus Heimdallarchaeota archaeon]